MKRIFITALLVSGLGFADEVKTGTGSGPTKPEACESAITAVKVTNIGRKVIHTSCECEREAENWVVCRAEVTLAD